MSDFVATRVMAKEDFDGQTHWIEAGWAENGERDNDQYVYTWDTNDRYWKFYEQYNLQDGMQIWITIDSEQSSTRSAWWRAWIWWNNAWNQLSREPLPIYDEAYMEEYIEVYNDPSDPDHLFLPRIDFDSVQVKLKPTGTAVYWTQPPVGTSPGSAIDPYCLIWDVRYNDFYSGTFC
jgi:hypothetical protein